MRIASVADAQAGFAAYVKASSKSPVIITRKGKAVAALISLADDEDLERLMLAYSPKLRAILAAARGRIRNGRGIPHHRFWQEAGAAKQPKPKRKPA